MNRFLKQGYGFLLATMLVGIGREAQAQTTWPSDSAPTLAWGVQLKNFNDSTENLDRIKSLGLSYVRRGFIWEGVEKQKGVYDFTAYDRLMKDCKARGISVIGCIAFGNKLYENVRTEDGRQGYAKFAAALAERYKDYDVVWELWNEPNTMTFWGRHGKVGNSVSYAEEYLALVKVAAPAIHKANPKAIVLGGAVSGLWTESYKWMDFCFKKGMLKTGIDAWSVHPYAFKCPEDQMDAYAKTRAMMNASGGPELPMLNSERGYPLGKAEGYAGGDAALSQEYQAWHIVRQYLCDHLSGLKVTIWYEWGGKEGFALSQPVDPLLPSFNACKVLMEQLKGYRLDKRLEQNNLRDFVLRFVNDTGAVKMVAWTAPPAGQSPDKIQHHSITLPVEAKGALETSDLYGKKGSIAAKNGSITLNLTGAPQYVTLNPGR
jgi:hypothetical protein